MSLVWLDLETTGTSSAEHDILEVAAIVTDDALNEVARFERVVRFDPAHEIIEAFENFDSYEQIGDRFGIDPYVVEMHHKNNLWSDCRSGDSILSVDLYLVDFITKHAVKEIADAQGRPALERPQLAGSTISFDRGFMEYHLPLAASCLHHRNVDVSTLNELGRRFWPDVYAARPNNKDKAHRGMADIEESIRVCKHYLARLASVNVSASGAVPVVVTSENVGRMQ